MTKEFLLLIIQILAGIAVFIGGSMLAIYVIARLVHEAGWEYL